VRWAERDRESSRQETCGPRACRQLIELCLEEPGDPRRLNWGRALPLYEQLDEPVGLADELNSLGSFSSGRPCGRARYFERSRLEYERAGDVVGEATAANNIGKCCSAGHAADAASR
jgi:hypothetical protein